MNDENERGREAAMTNTNLHLEALSDLEVASVADQALASLHARLHGDVEWDDMPTHEEKACVEAIEQACEAWDKFADMFPGFREVQG